MGIFSLITGRPGSSGFGSASTAEQVTYGIDATHLTVIITGGAAGIGLETARVLALRGAHVIIGARNMEAANEAKQLILNEDKTARVDVLKLDLCSIASIREFVQNFNALDLPLNILINNAGIMFCPYHLSQEGIEMQFATNHLGHFLLTNLLLDKMKNTAKTTGIEGRVVNLSSIAHQYTYKGGIRFEKINEKSGYSDKMAYGQSKLANILHANELSRRFQEEGANITANSVHPGLIMTNLFKYSAFLMSMFYISERKLYYIYAQMVFSFIFSYFYTIYFAEFLKFFSFFLWKNVPQGAATTCYVALHPNLKGVSGKYFVDCNEMTPSPLARDEVLARKLWEFSNKLITSISKA
ncbi:short-chain dehydrogenase TIC 32, chloroplastic-like isoform X1 [Pistacia vera]|uniref:short-chain dehydrogenase TIC 32, chloroplastic-like isoform X1 n=1 Tax=Pistacia vera TaxID=55513 RepID=UPI001262FAFE|nr:short-chain dehydrogenase TIC 32, chloroplastic-like isoform X1 [Pistacia vera]